MCIIIIKQQLYVRYKKTNKNTLPYTHIYIYTYIQYYNTPNTKQNSDSFIVRIIASYEEAIVSSNWVDVAVNVYHIYASITYLLHIYYVSITHLLRIYYASITHLLRIYYASITYLYVFKQCL